ncbi:MAG: NAD-glutamate dehydrogenase [Rhodococcus sp. (in: high G+C Gram-positive bacteria)]|uniref:NAD-glutamate dehydrogenase n=1 Tax=Rhodococcus sp. TaxID=1831 RepID=UPI002ADCE2AA|nr:NAD-glutamate dehydrogenase [Rhodococcus sp. (in: high G+C Gram-positive bacteria)]
MSLVSVDMTPDSENVRRVSSTYFEGLSADRYAALAEDRKRAIVAAHMDLSRRRGHNSSISRLAPAGELGDGPAIQYVGDDMPQLVEAVLATLARARMEPEFVVHPVLGTVVQPAHSTGGAQIGERTESWIHIGLPAHCSDEQAQVIAEDVDGILDRIAHAFRDSLPLRDLVDEAREQLDSDGYAEEADFLRWCSAGNFSVVGGARTIDGEETKTLGVLPDPTGSSDSKAAPLSVGVVSLGQGFGGSAYATEIDVSVGDRAYRFIGSLTATGLVADVRRTPLVRGRVADIFDASGSTVDSFVGQSMLAVIQSIPITVLFAAEPARIADALDELTSVDGRTSIHLFLQPVGCSPAAGPDQELSALLFVPREKFSTTIRTTAESVLADALGARNIEFSSRVSESPLAVVHFTAAVGGGANFASARQAREIRDLVVDACLTWDERFVLDASHYDERGRRARFAERVPVAYKQDFDAVRAAEDMAVFEGLAPGEVSPRLARSVDGPGTHRLGLYVSGDPLSLGEVLPVLQSLGVEVVDERPYELVPVGSEQAWIYEFTLDYPNAPVDGFDDFAARFAATFAAVRRGEAEPDSFNELVAIAGLGWKQVVVLRAYAEFLQQAGFPYSNSRVAEVLSDHPEIAGGLCELFESRFDPDAVDGDRGARAAAAVDTAVAQVQGLDADRILRAMSQLVCNTLRTNYFVYGTASLGALSLKFDSEQLSVLPFPRPKFEIFVYSPDVAGVHLRFGTVARGGLRWSDRKEDFRTEVLGLVKAQAVKNAVIVPVGAKGGFVVKRPPVPGLGADADREAALAAGIDCYRSFIRGLLDLTDNVDKQSGAVVAARRVVRHDGDDTYLVVAADKGTAKFSDIANEVAAEYGFWLGDAFASGGSVGYDHKAMGITAKGAWESVKRHFRELGVDTQHDDFTAVGIGDMSGDVFGNGMLCSNHIRLIAAFDHRHVFVDPNPAAERSYDERSRLFSLPRSSWADYDPTLISAGGGVWERSAKRVPISDEMRQALGLEDDVTELTPPQLVRAILRSPADLLWNGGIGTYVKASGESDLEVGDKSNDAVRVNGNEVRARVIGEGGNLGLTQAGRIEYARIGGRINTDALDNSAGVDCSDHEVNIKILLDSLISSGVVADSHRDALLESLTDQVAELVLADNRSQNELMGTTRADAGAMIGVHGRVISSLEARGIVDRVIEGFPTKKQFAAAEKTGTGLTSPELATLMAHVKLDLKSTLLAGSSIDNQIYRKALVNYFPEGVRDAGGDALDRHPLRREIVATVLTNSVVDRGGITYVYRLGEEVGADPEDAVRAFTVVSEVFGLWELWRDIREASISTAVSDELILLTRRLLDRASRWMLTRRPQPLAVGAEISRFGDRIAEASAELDGWLVGADQRNLAARTVLITDKGAPENLVRRVEILLDQFGLLDVVEIADLADRTIAETGELYFRLGEHVGLVPMLNRVSALSKDGKWNALARLSLRDELYSTVRALTLDVLADAQAGDSTAEKLSRWEERNASRIERSTLALAEIEASGQHDLAALSVATSQLRRMVG